MKLMTGRASIARVFIHLSIYPFFEKNLKNIAGNSAVIFGEWNGKARALYLGLGVAVARSL